MPTTYAKSGGSVAPHLCCSLKYKCLLAEGMGAPVRVQVPGVKLIVSDPESGKATMYELKDEQAQVFRGMRIGDKVDGGIVGIEGEMKITGGSDRAGFPMRADVLGGVKKYVLLTKGVGFRSKVKGMKKRKMVRGNTITDDIYQINVVLIRKKKRVAEASGEAASEPTPSTSPTAAEA